MHTSQKGFATVALILIIAALVAVSGVYIYSSHRNQSAGDDLISAARRRLEGDKPSPAAAQVAADLAWAKTRLQMETNKLDLLRQQITSGSLSGDALRSQFDQTKDAIENKVDKLFKDPGAENLEFKFKTYDPARVRDILAMRQQISILLDEWQKLANAPYSPMATLALQEAALHDIPIIQNYLNAIDALINSVTVTSSGLSQAQLDALQQLINAAGAQVDTAAVVTQPVTPAVVVAQEQVVQQVQNEVNHLQDQVNNPPVTSPTTTPPTTPGQTPPTSNEPIYTPFPQTPGQPQPIVDPDPGTPKLIQGANDR